MRHDIPHAMVRGVWSEREMSLGLMSDVYWLTVRSRELIECGVVVGWRLSRRGKKWLVVVLSWSMNRLNEQSRRTLVYCF